MSKHQEILDYLEKLPIGKRVSVRSISNFLNVSDGTAYRAIKEAENQGIVETRPRSGTIRVKSKKAIGENNNVIRSDSWIKRLRKRFQW